MARRREKVYSGESLSDEDRRRLARPSSSGKRMLGPLESEDCGHGEKRVYRWIWDVGSGIEDSEPDVVKDPDCSKVCVPDDDVFDENPARGAIKYSCDYCGQRKRTCPRCPACGHHVCSACATPSCHFCDSIRRSIERTSARTQPNPRMRAYVAAPGSLLHVKILDPGRRPRRTLTVEPMIPERPLGGEDTGTPRVCLAPTLGGCLAAIEAWSRIGPPSIDGSDQIVVYENVDPVEVLVPSRRLVDDAPETGEVWALEPVRLCKVRVADQAGMQQAISDILDDFGNLSCDADVVHAKKAALVDAMLGIEEDYLGRP